MAKEKVKVELELPKDQVTIEPVDKENVSSSSSPNGKSNKEDDSSNGPVLLGYKPEEILKAPSAATPEPESKKPPNKSQRLIIYIGLIIGLGGLLILWPLVSFLAGLIVAIVGAILITYGTLIKT